MTSTAKTPSRTRATMTSEADAKKKFEARARRILKQWSEDTPSPVPHPKFEHHRVSARDRMHIRTYKLIRDVKVQGFGAVFLDMVTSLGVRHHLGDKPQLEPVRLALLLMASWDSELTTLRWARQRRKELADQIEYADHHDVPWEYFNAFIKEAGAGAIKARRAAKVAADREQAINLSAGKSGQSGARDRIGKRAQDPVFNAASEGTRKKNVPLIGSSEDERTHPSNLKPRSTPAVNLGSGKQAVTETAKSKRKGASR